jgi:diguanylate cyclase (GGDEF)-like protein/PAS domain S-box-containing protein
MNGLAILAVTFALLLAGGAVLTVRQLRAALAKLKDEQRELRSAASRAQMLQALFESSDDGLFICDAVGDITAANAAAGKLLGLSRKEIVGSTITQWVRHGAARPPAAADAGDQGAGFPLADGEAELRHQRKGVAIRVRVDVQAPQAGHESRRIVRLRDLTDEQRTQRKIGKLANFDALTGLPNRTQFRDRLLRAMTEADRHGRTTALLLLDLDRFKVINDSLGHESGDRLLVQVAQVLTANLTGRHSVLARSVRDGTTLSRVGGDEFTVIVEDIGSTEQASVVARHLIDALGAPIGVGEQQVQVSASIGIAMYPAAGVDLDGMIRRADLAMYRSKAMGRNTFTFFSDELHAAVDARLAMEASLRQALERREFSLHYQPKVRLEDRQITGVEALLRWHCPGRGMVPPDRFIPILEETGMIIPVGAWAFREACRQLAAWDAEGLPRISMAVNLSARQLRHPVLVTMVRDTLVETGLDPARVELELTESMLMEDAERSRAVLGAFQKLGVSLAIDDFGTGHSSLSHLRRLEVDTLKIDRSFVMELPRDTEDAAIATAIIAMARSLEMKVVAEGVETEEQAAFLHGLGCDVIQGWLMSRALPADQLSQWVMARLESAKPPRFQSDDVLDLPTIEIPQAPRDLVGAAA